LNKFPDHIILHQKIRTSGRITESGAKTKAEETPKTAPADPTSPLHFTVTKKKSCVASSKIRTWFQIAAEDHGVRSGDRS
jgi:hypothetical protein